MEILLTKSLAGHLVPASDEDFEKCRRFKVGDTLRCEVTKMRNAKFFRKWWALAKLAYDIWSETVPAQEYKGAAVMADFDRFRRDLTVLAGFYRPVFNVKSECRLEPESLKWSQMDEERFEALYNATINAVLQNVIPKAGYDEAKLRAAVDDVMRFA